MPEDVALGYGYWTGYPPVITGPGLYGFSDMVKIFSRGFFRLLQCFDGEKVQEYIRLHTRDADEEVELRAKKDGGPSIKFNSDEACAPTPLHRLKLLAHFSMLYSYKNFTPLEASGI